MNFVKSSSTLYTIDLHLLSFVIHSQVSFIQLQWKITISFRFIHISSVQHQSVFLLFEKMNVQLVYLTIVSRSGKNEKKFWSIFEVALMIVYFSFRDSNCARFSNDSKTLDTSIGSFSAFFSFYLSFFRVSIHLMTRACAQLLRFYLFSSNRNEKNDFFSFLFQANILINFLFTFCFVQIKHKKMTKPHGFSLFEQV